MVTPTKTTVDQVTFTTDIQAPVSQVYEAFTNRDDASDWLGDDGEVRAEAGGFALYFRRDGWNAHGTFKEVIEHEKLVLTWHDGSDHPTTLLKVTLHESGDVTTLNLTHSGFETGDAAETYQNFWKRALYELKTLLETGARADIVDRIIIGIFPADLTEEFIETHNLPVTEGTRVGGVVDGYSAQAAGIQVDDVIVAIDDMAVNSGTAMHEINADKKPGDVVDVSFYRGTEKHTVSTELKGYPIPPIPESFSAMANHFENIFKDQKARLSAVLAKADDKLHADKKTANGESTLRELIAQLILSRRHNLEYISTYIQGPRRINPYTRMPARINALIATYPKIADLEAHLWRSADEMVALIRQVPAEQEARKHNIWWMSFELQFVTQGFDTQLESIEDLLAD